MMSSTMPGIEENSCCTPWILILVIGAALQAREQNPPQAVADGVAEAALERLDVELAEGVGQGLAAADDPAGQFEATPTNTHRNLPIPINARQATAHSRQRLNNSMINCGVTGSRHPGWTAGG